MRRLHLALPATAVAAMLVLGCGQGKAPANAGAGSMGAAASAPTSQAAQPAAPTPKGDMTTLMTFEQRIQEYADRIALAADKGESMGIVYNSMNYIGDCLKGGAKHIEWLKKGAGPADQAKLATIEQHHAEAQAAYEKLGAELKKDPISKIGVIKASYTLSDAATLAQGKTPAKHPTFKEDAAKPAAEKAAPAN